MASITELYNIIRGIKAVSKDQLERELDEKQEQIETLKTNNKRLTDENQNMKNKMNLLQQDLNETKVTINQLLNGSNMLKTYFNETNIEELSKLAVTETCLELKNYGLNISKEFTLDPDGLNQGQIPIKAWCEIPEGITKIGETTEIEITHCDSLSCFTHDFEYAPIMIDQMKALINTSSECFQEMTFYCHSTLLISITKITNLSYDCTLQIITLTVQPIAVLRFRQ